MYVQFRSEVLSIYYGFGTDITVEFTLSSSDGPLVERRADLVRLGSYLITLGQCAYTIVPGTGRSMITLYGGSLCKASRSGVGSGIGEPPSSQSNI